MKIQTSSTLATAAIIMGLTFFTACVDMSGPTPVIQKCGVSVDTDFPFSGSISLEKPAQCPVALTGVMQIPYAATVTLPIGSVAYGAYQVITTTWRGQDGGFVTYPVWSQGDGSWFISISGDYYAATGGFDGNNGGYDDIRNGFYLPSGSWTYATTRVGYQYGDAFNSISTTQDVPPNQAYPVSATSNDPLLVGPVTWSWYVDGTLNGTTSDPQFSVMAGDPLTQQQVQVVATDVNGHAVSGQTQVFATAGCGTQLIC